MFMKRTALCVGRISNLGQWGSERWNRTYRAKNTDYVKARQQPAIASFCSNISTASDDVNATTLDVTLGNPQPTMSADLRAICGSTATLRAEVIWVLRTVTSHNSYRSNDGIEEVFKTMFPDSGLVHSFTCGKDKTRYVAKFGLAPYIKKRAHRRSPKMRCVCNYVRRDTKPNNQKQTTGLACALLVK